MPRITISYRRDDSGAITGRIFDRLAAHYGRDSIFRDIDNIPPGVDFRKHIDSILDESDVVLAVVGPRWIGPRGGHSRLENAADPVRVEIETALRKNTPLIPVLVSRGAMPRVEQLPESLKDFAYHNAVSIDTGQDFDVHMSRLMRAMDRFFEDGGGQIPKATLDTISSEPTEFAAPGAEPEISEIAALRETNHQLQGRVAALTAERDAAVMAAAEAPELPPLRRQLRDLTRHLASAGKAALARRGDDRELARAQAKVDQLSFRVNELTQQLRAARAAGPARRHPAMVALFTAAVLMGAVATLIIVDITQWHRSVLWAERAVLSARAWWH